jgi:hypothetical protein
MHLLLAGLVAGIGGVEDLAADLRAVVALRAGSLDGANLSLHGFNGHGAGGKRHGYVLLFGEYHTAHISSKGLFHW